MAIEYRRGSTTHGIPGQEFSLTIGGKTPGQLEQMLDSQKGVLLGSYGRTVLRHSREFTTEENPREIQLFRLESLWDIVENPVTLQEMFERAESHGLYPCPAEVGPHLRPEDTDQPKFDRYIIAMNPITVSNDGNPGVFLLERGQDKLHLDGYWAPSSTSRWIPGSSIVFERKS